MTDKSVETRPDAAAPPSPTARPIDEGALTRFAQGLHPRLWELLGAHRHVEGGQSGVRFAVWAPAVETASVIGDFNDWDDTRHPLRRVADSGVWVGFVADVARGARYKFHLRGQDGAFEVDKADPFAFSAQIAPETASVVWDLDYAWGDAEWLRRRAESDPARAPMSIYELHLGSWKRPGGAWPSYTELAEELVPYLQRLGFTHVEFLPPMEHPFYGSWGYQSTGYFAPTARYGSPQQLMQLIDALHNAGIGVILDWVPSHFPSDEHGLGYFDGTRLYEHEDPQRGYHPDWTSYIFDYSRNEVRSFLVSSAMFWIERYHADGLRVDAVASMLHLDYSRNHGEWKPNRHGGRENLEAIEFLRELNQTVHEDHPDVLTVAEESSAWPMVSRPAYLGGLGFDMKWDMGWMHDTLEYMRLDPIYRRFHHDKLTFRMLYAWAENFVLALSHDEVVHGKASLLGKMFGDHWTRFANLRALLGYMFGQPGKKLLFMGAEIGPWREWDHESELEWDLLRYAPHAGLQGWVADLNRLYREQPALHRADFDPVGFGWNDCADAEQSVVSFTRHDPEGAPPVLVVSNFTPVPRHNYRIGVTRPGEWVELLNSDAECYGGSGVGNLGAVSTLPIPWHGQAHSLCLTLPPLATLFLTPGRDEEPAPGAAT